MATYLDHEKFGSRIAMAEKMNVNFTAEYNQKQVRAYSKLYQDAVKLMNSEDLNAFDITKNLSRCTNCMEPRIFGQGCLLARRLIENKVRYVESHAVVGILMITILKLFLIIVLTSTKLSSALLTDLELRSVERNSSRSYFRIWTYSKNQR